MARLLKNRAAFWNIFPPCIFTTRSPARGDECAWWKQMQDDGRPEGGAAPTPVNRRTLHAQRGAASAETETAADERFLLFSRGETFSSPCRCVLLGNFFLRSYVGVDKKHQRGVAVYMSRWSKCRCVQNVLLLHEYNWISKDPLRKSQSSYYRLQ